MNTRTINDVTDLETLVHEACYGTDHDPDEVTPEPGHTYASCRDARLYYLATDGAWWTIDEETGGVAESTAPDFPEHAEIDINWFRSWADTNPDDFAEVLAQEETIARGKTAIETAPVGYGAILGAEHGWSACLAIGTTLAACVAGVRLAALAEGDSPERTMNLADLLPVTRRYMSAWRIDESTACQIREVLGQRMIDLTDAAIERW